MARTKKNITTQSQLPVSSPIKANGNKPKRKRVPGWHDNKGPKGIFWTSDDFAAYPLPDGRFKAFQIDENGTLVKEVGVFPSLEEIKIVEPKATV